MTSLVIPLFNARELGRKIALKSDKQLADVEVRKFPDREVYFRVDSSVKGNDIILVQSGYPGPNHALVETLLAADTCKDNGAKSITLVMAYMPYARQDTRFKKGEAFSLQAVAKLLLGAGVEKLITIDAHNWAEYGEMDLHGLKNLNISAGKLLVEHLMKKHKIEKVHILSPDMGASKLVEEAAKAKGAEFSALNKERKGDFEVSMTGKLDVKGKDVIILDDIISTGRTMLLALEKVKEAGAKRVFLAGVHGIFGWGSLEKLKKKADDLVSTDSIENEASEVSLAGEVAGVI
jgi:ribose-phosphate pyrophosphokinase|tara:strand:- start:2245 stop:3120 length:876 start_codon:yes stop_codon:yes gene_type:complete